METAFSSLESVRYVLPAGKLFLFRVFYLFALVFFLWVCFIKIGACYVAQVSYNLLFSPK